jgi:glycerophosphoryl diester phosphodiesterase
VTAVFAHRGCHGVPAPGENTLAAFRAARRSGADGVELDVRTTADGQAAVLHDRLVPGAGDVSDIVAAALPEDVPLLADALAACSGLWVNVEIRGGPAEAALVAGRPCDREPGHREAPAGVLVSSFNPDSLAAAREAAPGVACGLLVDWRADAAAALELAAGLGCATLHPFVTQVDAVLADAARELGIGLPSGP